VGIVGDAEPLLDRVEHLERPSHSVMTLRV
jgi:hypothetical protein